MKSAVWAEIDLNYLKQNLKIIRSCLASPGVEVLAVVKADAYGHGMKEVARTLAGEGVRFFGVATLEEALELRKVCPRERILVLGGFHSKQASLFAQKKITPTISCVEDVRALEKALGRSRGGFPAHVKVDTGMGRLGVWHRDVPRFLGALGRRSPLLIEGLYTHFSSADLEDPDFTERQLAVFNGVIRQVKSAGFSPRYLHAANSMGLLRFKNAHFNLVRPGILLYGLNPARDARLPQGIRPILSLKTRISFLKEVAKGRTISYGATFAAPAKTRIATLPVGYSHGYRVGFSNKAFVAVRGTRCPVVGRVTMDQTLVDVGKLPSVKRWDEVTLIGEDRSVRVSAEELAQICGTIPYEIVCSIHSRIPRLYKGMR
ncbi:MAG: alanine racemase [Candidatus Omnitrophota bacterium]